MVFHSQIDKILKTIARESRAIFADKLVDILLYGSYARGDYDQDSDLDIMVLVDMAQELYSDYRHTLNTLSGSLSLESNMTISIKVKDSKVVYRYKDSVPFYENVLKEGVSLVA